MNFMRKESHFKFVHIFKCENIENREIDEQCKFSSSLDVDFVWI